MRTIARYLCATALATGCSAPAEWHDEGPHRWKALPARGAGGSGFTHLAGRATGIRFRNDIDDSTLASNTVLANGSGVALGDYDGDGWTDVFFGAINGNVRLYRNLGAWRFEDVTAQSGVARPGRAISGAVFADVDGDGDLDLLLSAVGAPLAYFRNGGAGRFERAEGQVGLGGNEGGTTLALADVDGDGDLDLYVANYKRRFAADLPAGPSATDQVLIRTGKGFAIAPQFERHFRMESDSVRGVFVTSERAEPDWFYLNDGRGHFEAIPFTSGRFRDAEGAALRETPELFGLSAAFHDVSGDGAPDLYVCNDFGHADALWINDGSGTFRAVAPNALRSTSLSSMGVDFSDVDRDGDTEMFIADMLSRSSRRRKAQGLPVSRAWSSSASHAAVLQIPQNTLQLNNGDSTFSQIADAAGIAASDWSWTPLFLDGDLDGYEDLFVTAGYEWDMMNSDALESVRLSIPRARKAELRLYPKLAVPSSAFRNNGDLTFTDKSDSWGFGVGPDIAHGMAAADLDNDGDLDLVVNRWRQEASVFRNDASAARIAVRVIGQAPNTQAIGALISVVGGPAPLQTKEVTSGGHYLSGSDPIYSFAAGSATQVEIRVRWRRSEETVITARPNRLYELREPSSQTRTAPTMPARTPPIFSDVSTGLRHIHRDSAFDDFERQALLPGSLAQRGPGVAWFDWDADGDEDLFITGGTGGALAAYRNDRGHFTRLRVANGLGPHDQTAVIGTHSPAGAAELLVARSNYELGGGFRPLQPLASIVKLDKTLRTASQVAFPDSASVGAMALADVDGDGDLDLFAGTLTYPGKFPLSPGSVLYLRVGDRFVPDQSNSAVLSGLGSVSAAVFSDIDQDGDPDLLIAQAWGQIRALRNDRGVLSDITQQTVLDQYTGRWNGLATADFNSDGLPDIIATGWGTNTGVKASFERPLLLYYGDFDRSGTLDLVMAQYDEELGAVGPLASLDRLALGVPAIRNRVGSYKRFSAAGIEVILGPYARNARYLSANTLEHMVFLSRPAGGYDARALPFVAQMAPAFAAGVADFDADGNEDVFLAQNFFGVPPGEHRYDAGSGLWLKGDGKGGLTPVPPSESGVRVIGEQRAVAVSDFDHDGRVDLVVSQNAGETKLYRNTSPSRGLRVRLQGGVANPFAVGATLRPMYGARLGPIREIQGAAGYAAQNGATQILGNSERISELVVRWPGGDTSRVRVAAGSREVVVRHQK